jgi:hypothetical protein
MKAKNLLTGLALASSALLSVNTLAAIIPAWDWTTDGGFVNGAGDCNQPGISEAACTLTYDNASGLTPSGIAGTSSVMTWGTPSQRAASTKKQSGLQVVFGASGLVPGDAALLGSAPVMIPAFEDIITNAGWTNTGAAIHYNNILLQTGGFMTSSELFTTFQLLTPGAGPVLGTGIDIDFTESFNFGSADDCSGENPHGTACDDIFSLSLLPDPTSFTIDGQLYKLSFRYFAGPGAILIGEDIFTAEVAPGTSVLFTQARIDTIPVPGVLALMGMGLMVMGWRARKAA